MKKVWRLEDDHNHNVSHVQLQWEAQVVGGNVTVYSYDDNRDGSPSEERDQSSAWDIDMDINRKTFDNLLHLPSCSLRSLSTLHLQYFE